MRGLDWCLVGAVVLSGLGSPAFGERVGYKFEGGFVITTGSPYSLFGVSVPRNSPIKGTFSFDTTTVGTEIEPGAKAFPQTIPGGYALDINNGALRLAASEYQVKVANDFVRTPEAVDIFSIDFDNRFAPAPAPISVNGTPWAGLGAALTIELSWPAATFTAGDEPKLTADRPETPVPGVTAFVGSANASVNPTVRLFSITSLTKITPAAADYNVDGVVNNYDFTAWTRAFGGSSAELLYADGNDDLVIDAADYSVWRDAMGGASAAAAVPEPSGVMILLGISGMLWQRRRANWTLARAG